MVKIILFSLAILFSEQILSKTIEYFQFETITKINLIDYSNDDNYPYVSFVFNDYIPTFPMEPFVKYRNNSTKKHSGKFLTITRFSNDKWNNTNYSTVEEAEFVLNYYNISKIDLFDKHLFDENLMNYISIIPNKDYSISYYTNFSMLVYCLCIRIYKNYIIFSDN